MTLQQLIDEIKTGKYSNIDDLHIAINDPDILIFDEWFDIPGRISLEKAQHLLSKHAPKPASSLTQAETPEYQKTLTAAEFLERKFKGTHRDASTAINSELTFMLLEEYADQQKRELMEGLKSLIEITEKTRKHEKAYNKRIESRCEEQQKELESLRKKCEMMEKAIRGIVPRIETFAGLKRNVEELKESLTDDKG